MRRRGRAITEKISPERKPSNTRKTSNEEENKKILHDLKLKIIYSLKNTSRHPLVLPPPNENGPTLTNLDFE